MRNNEIINWINYYRNSLADGELIDIKKKDYKEGEFYNSIEELSTHNLIKLYSKLSKTQETKNSSKGDKDEFIDIFIAPFYLKAEISHSKKTKNTKKIFPFWVPSTIKKNGELTINSETNRVPWFIRSVLEPVFYDSNDFPIVSSIENVDEKISKHIFNYDSWYEFWQSCEVFFKKITESNYSDFQMKGFSTINEICIIKAKEVVTGESILQLYNDLKRQTDIPILLKNILSISEKKQRKKIPEENNLLLLKKHYGQYQKQFPLSPSQRKSLLLFENEDIGNVFAVNGPPGTGKTTLLQSIVANKLVNAVINESQPPKIIASSTNNQAITNILDSFKSTNDNLNRWLPQVSSLGTYLISSDTKKQSLARDKGYQILTNEYGNLDGFYFKNLHNSSINEIEKYYKNCYLKENNTNSLTIKEITQILKNQIKNDVKIINEVLDLLKEIKNAENKHGPLEQLYKIYNEIEIQNKRLASLKNEQQKLYSFSIKYNKFLEKNKLSLYLSFIPFFKKIYKQKLNIFLINERPTDNFKHLNTNSEIENQLKNHLNSIDRKIPSIEYNINQKQNIYYYLKELKSKYEILKNELHKKWNDFLKEKNENDKNSISKEFEMLSEFEKINQILDISYRFDAFSRAIHYFEGQWIINQQTETPRRNRGLKSRKDLFKRISYITPLFISTFHSLPKFSSYSHKTPDDWIKKPIYELFDLIIVDEAGQVSPEVGIASFSLAKNALVVGDIHQIKPVWNIAYEQIDKGNLDENNLLDKYDINSLKKSGVLSSSGSLMHVAQLASNYEVDSEIKGTILTEHRRCVDELIAFSNEYVYSKNLEPKIGSLNKTQIKDNQHELSISPLSYINVRSYSEKRNGSRFNKEEAKAIAKWINIYGNALLKKFEKAELKDCIAVITPFAAQKREIYNQFSSHKLNKNITVGTVHSLQGAEKPIIIFSPTYGVNHGNGQLFFDNGYNMLNVALTRAEKHFIVIGNMNLFNPKNTHKPSGGLAQYLFEKNSNELPTSFIFDNLPYESKNRVDTLEKHQRCIDRVFETANERIIIISPFISIHAINSDNIIEKISEVSKKNVKVIVYTDEFLDTQNGKIIKKAAEGRKALKKAGAKLKVLNGIHNKAIVKDNDILIEGSFNWLSATRDKSSFYSRYEVSQIIDNKEVKNQIALLLKDLDLISKKVN